jgi:hypothetical protein
MVYLWSLHWGALFFGWAGCGGIDTYAPSGTVPVAFRG